MSEGSLQGQFDKAFAKVGRMKLPKDRTFEELVKALMKSGWSKAGARHRANLALGGGFIK